jgi:hypothetical protein
MHLRWGAVALLLTAWTASGEAAAFPCLDLDDDGYSVCDFGCRPTPGNVCGDCDDLRGAVHPGGTESCGNGLDDDCDGAIDADDGDCSGEPCPWDPTADTDRDAVADCHDNCPGTANVFQQDYDADGLGDACETGQRLCDIDRSGRVDGLDLAALGRTFGRRCQDGGFDRRADLTRDCRVDGDDLSLLAALFGAS